MLLKNVSISMTGSCMRPSVSLTLIIELMVNRDVPIWSQRLCIGADQGIFNWSVSAILSTNLNLILCFPLAVTQVFLIAELSCAATRRVQPSLLRSAELRVRSLGHTFRVPSPQTSADFRTGTQFHSYYSWGSPCVHSPTTLWAIDCNVSYCW